MEIEERPFNAQNLSPGKDPKKAAQQDQPLIQKPQCKVSVKYQLFRFHNAYIKHISISSKGVLAFSSGNPGQTVKFVQPSTKQLALQTVQFQLHRSINIRHNILEWSPNGGYLAVGGSQLSVWQWEGDQIQMFKEYVDNFYEICAFAWSPSSKKFAVGSINHNLSLVIRDISQEDKIKTILVAGVILAISWDPFEKHLACLVSNNTLVVYSCSNWECIHTISLYAQARTQISRNQSLSIDWSPDYRYLVSPAIDDKPVPFAVALDRSRNFSFKGIFMGPFSTINCIKFNPNLYELPTKQIVNVFAMGDSEGNISLWALGQKHVSKKPLMFFKSKQDSNQIIEKIQWNVEGTVLYATTFKRYLITVVFEEGTFGRKLEQLQRHQVLEGLYGSVKSTNNQFKVFRFGDTKQMETEEKEQPKQVHSKNDQYVFTQQKVITTAGNKKKIVPAMLVKASQKQATQNRIYSVTATNVPTALRVPIVSQVETVPTQKAPQNIHRITIEHHLMLPVLQTSQSSYRISSTQYIQLDRKQGQTMMSIYHQDPAHEGKQLLSSIPVPGSVNSVQTQASKLIVYTNQGYIYFFTLNGTACELPILVGQVHMIRVTDAMDILILSTSCNLKLFNLSKKKLYVNTSILQLLNSNLQLDSMDKKLVKVVESMEVSDSLSVFLVLGNKKKFVLGETITWHLVPNQVTCSEVQPKSQCRYPEISQSLQRLSLSFFEVLSKPPNLASLQQLEYNLIYFRNQNPNRQKYGVSLLSYIEQLDTLQQSGKLRQVLIDHFADSSKTEYNCIHPLNRELIKGIRSLNSQVVNQLIDVGVVSF